MRPLVLAAAMLWLGGNAAAADEPAPLSTASFRPPAGCQVDPALAAAAKVGQACIERFSPTHEFVITLREIRVRNADSAAVPDLAAQKAVVEDHLGRMRRDNAAIPGQLLAKFDWLEAPREALPAGADYCVNVWTVTIDRRVPGFGTEEFRIWGNMFVCTRAEPSDRSIRLVELKASERFRVATDRFRERFSADPPTPVERFLDAIDSLTMIVRR